MLPTCQPRRRCLGRKSAHQDTSLSAPEPASVSRKPLRGIGCWGAPSRPPLTEREGAGRDLRPWDPSPATPLAVGLTMSMEAQLAVEGLEDEAQFIWWPHFLTLFHTETRASLPGTSVGPCQGHRESRV